MMMEQSEEDGDVARKIGGDPSKDKSESPSESVASPSRPAPWVPDVLQCVARTASQFTVICLAVVIGTSLGNGVPMARTASQNFNLGLQAGLRDCPCRHHGPTPVKAASPGTVKRDAQALVPVPEAVGVAGQTAAAVKRDAVETDEGFQTIKSRVARPLEEVFNFGDSPK
jgi:hypothetical protein